MFLNPFHRFTTFLIIGGILALHQLSLFELLDFIRKDGDRSWKKSVNFKCSERHTVDSIRYLEFRITVEYIRICYNYIIARKV